MGHGSADEAARLLWDCAGDRNARSWALPLLLQRIAPQDSKLRLEVGRVQDEIDFAKLTNEELEAPERILDRAAPLLSPRLLKAQRAVCGRSLRPPGRWSSPRRLFPAGTSMPSPNT
jgi:hypothetical protein